MRVELDRLNKPKILKEFQMKPRINNQLKIDQREKAIKNGFMFYRWVSHSDSRPAHLKLDRKIIAFECPVDLENGIIGHPGDDDNCRCIAVFLGNSEVVKEWKKDKNQFLDNGSRQKALEIVKKKKKKKPVIIDGISFSVKIRDQNERPRFLGLNWFKSLIKKK